MQIGYARTPTLEQAAGFEGQQRDLKAAGCEKLFVEQVSSVAKRPQLEAAIDCAREGDVFIVTKPCRLARNLEDLRAIVLRLQSKGVALVVQSMGSIDTRTPTGKPILNVIGSIAEFECELMLKRQREGITKAKGEGKYKGRTPTAARQEGEMRRLLGEGVKPAEIARRLGVACSSAYRVIDPASAARDAA